MNYYYLLFFLLIESAYTIKPLSQCSNAVATFYEPYDSGASCGFGVPKMYGAALDDKIYKNGEKCGICYELVGPKGAVKIMVDNYDPEDSMGKEDWPHFDCHKNTFEQIADDSWGILNVTWRMVACGHEGNIFLNTYVGAHDYYYSFVVSNHEIGLKHVYYSSNNKDWTLLKREGDYNRWTVPGQTVFPAYFQFESIDGEKVTTKIDELKQGYSHDTGVQFKVPDKYFDARSLNEVPKVNEKCCKLFDAYTQIYYDGRFYSEWGDVTEATKDYNVNCVEEGKKCIKFEFHDWNVFKFMNRFKAEVKRYNAIEFYIKSESVCKSCLNIMLDGYNWHSLTISDVDRWEKITLSFKDLGIKDDATEIESFMFQGASTENKIIYFDQIKLVKSDYTDNGKCSDGSDGDKSDRNNDNFSNYINISYLLSLNIIISCSLLFF